MAREAPREDEIAPGWVIVALLLVAAAVLVAAPFCGTERIPLGALWGEASDHAQVDILWKLRMPRVAMAFVAGAALATGGMIFQAMFRSPLATPFTLGVSSGASLGAVLCMQQGWAFAVLGISSVSLSAIAGAALAVALLYAISSRHRQGTSTATMLLAGAAVSFCFSCLILLVQSLDDVRDALPMLRWVVGGLESVVGFHDVLGVLPVMATGCLIGWYLTHELNLLSIGEDFAFSRGVGVGRTKLLLLGAVVLMVGATVAACGPIGLLGLMVPWACRLRVGADHRYLLPATWICGGTVLVVFDTAVRLLPTPAELPVGLLTALTGGPFFLWLLLSRRECDVV